ncbi:Hsp20/alpha crystallin family protein [Ammoniphilus sp. CFH 90114]|uniref:Hsp20/alpha crystallin family protein n=1 Tax=Ammoniphilus sp. CFH 90114 TaxID=2493665 RepID=UPI0013E8FFB4|nr:Hsp20/alpha crystallin family protein [Ammoniphilus sp. CFH 90114]
MDKLKQWLEIAQQNQPKQFWNNVFHPSSKQDGNISSLDDRKVKFPTADIYVNDTSVTVIIELPGLTKNDIEILISYNKLVIKGNMPAPTGSMQSIQTERRYGPFERVLELPEPTEARHVQARFDHGLLILTYMRRNNPAEKVFIE